MKSYMGWATSAMAVLLIAAGTAAGQAAAGTGSRAGASAQQAPDSVSTTASDTSRVYAVGEVVVLARRDPVNRAATVHEWGGERIARLAATDAEAALRYMPGVYFSRSTRNQSTFRLRGFEQRQVAVFLDGVPISVPFDGLVDISQLAGVGIERIQVSHGFASVLYGASSLGGTVNLLTGQPSAAAGLGARLEGSTDGRTHGAATATAGAGRLWLVGSGSFDASEGMRLPDGYEPTLNEDGGLRENSAYSKRQGSIRARYVVDSRHQLDFAASAVDNHYDVPPNAVSEWARYWRFPEWRKQVLSFGSRHDLHPNISIRTRLYQDAYQNRLESFDDASYSTQEQRYAFNSLHDDVSRGAHLLPTLQLLPFGATDAVLAYRHDVHRERNEGEPFDRYAAGTLTAGIEQDVALSPSLSLVVGAGAAWLRPVAEEGGSRPEPMSQLDGQVAVRYALTDWLESHAGLSRKSRFPTLKEIHSGRMGRSIPNPDLAPESSVHTEVGLRATAGGWTGGVSAFHSALRDLIASAVVGDGMEQMQNIRTARIRGLEAHLARDWRAVGMAVNYTFVEALNTAPGRDSDHLEYRPAHRFNALTHLRPHDRIEVGAELSHTARQYYQNPDTGVWERLNDMTRLDLRAELGLARRLFVYVRADNVLDATYFGEFGVPLAGRELTFGSRLEL